ncbi:hypothetical protein [Ekhidna sp.]|uniref:hypothetical protein n=1 Tax=Ekhidna sp. TaxID=2608089 RepID=UPI0032ECC17D
METLTRSRHSINTLILKTNIRTTADVEKVSQAFSKLNCIKRWTVDIDDWEHVLKVEVYMLSYKNIAVLLDRIGYECSELDH